MISEDMNLPFAQAGLAARIRREGEVLEEEYTAEGLRLTASVPPEMLSLIEPYCLPEADLEMP